MKISKLNFRHKLALLIMLTTSVALVLAGAGFVTYDLILARQSIIRNLETDADHIGSTCTAALRFGDRQTARESLAIMSHNPHVAVAAVYDEDGALFADYIRPGAEIRPPRRPQADGSLFAGDNIDLFHSISLEGQHLGKVYIRRSLRDVNRRLRYNALVAGLVFLVCFAVAVGIATRFQRVLTEPLGELLRTAADVTRKQDYSLRAHKVSDDELGSLTDQLNQMLAEIQRRDAELQGVRDQLEERVAERTLELRQQRTAALNMMEDAHDARREAEAAEQNLARAAEELERSNKELEQFASVASHDLQEPLRKIKSFTQLFARHYRNEVDEEGQKYIDFIVSGAERMQGLIQDLLTFARAGRGELDLAATDLKKIMAEVLANIEMAVRDTDAEVTVGELPTVTVNARLIGMVFQNLLVNAIKFKGEQTPIIHVGAERVNNEWVISVCDNGIGMEERHFERIFQVFQRLHGRGTYPGSGIGLAVCKKIVERHGGHIWVRSEPGQGSTFFFSLPQKSTV